MRINGNDSRGLTCVAKVFGFKNVRLVLPCEIDGRFKPCGMTKRHGQKLFSAFGSMQYVMVS